MCVCVQSCPTLHNPKDCSSPRSSVHGIFQANCSGLPFPTPGDLPDSGIEPASLTSPELTGEFFPTSATWTLKTYQDSVRYFDP